MSSGFSHAEAGVRIHFLFKAESVPLCASTPSRSSIHLSVNTCALGDNGALNMGVRLSHEDPASTSFGSTQKWACWTMWQFCV